MNHKFNEEEKYLVTEVQQDETGAFLGLNILNSAYYMYRKYAHSRNADLPINSHRAICIH